MGDWSHEPRGTPDPRGIHGSVTWILHIFFLASLLRVKDRRLEKHHDASCGLNMVQHPRLSPNEHDACMDDVSCPRCEVTTYQTSRKRTTMKRLQVLLHLNC